MMCILHTCGDGWGVTTGAIRCEVDEVCSLAAMMRMASL